jgi:hypothetical protein
MAVFTQAQKTELPVNPMTYIQRGNQHHTYADFLTWSANHGNEPIDGVAYVREPPSPSWHHQEMVLELLYQIRAAMEDKPWRVFGAPLDVRLPKSNEKNEQVDTAVPGVSVDWDRLLLRLFP